ncbi:pilus assembly protein CpaD [Altererythrobacter sp. B11]|uniref:CpaD family pilus assembly protein n=1 Tax=Altererythrobacter sp. B11 TaxID=2060312 RepID=UPI000DC6FDAA|nr:CpaD family pilus assembly protein [Altererythrobacter sp. B11]BBC74171.1 pilus assembly protein CpaD [Altererythrobacter sp. B11]
MHTRTRRTAALVTALSLGLGVSACSVPSGNATLYSVNQPVVERQNFTLDVAAGSDGLSIPEKQRLAGWFETLDLAYGDRVAIDGALGGSGLRDDVSEIAGRHGILLSDEAPVTEGYVDPGKVRVVVTRSRAHVPGCPKWGEAFTNNQRNETTAGYGCAINSNIAAMVANPEDLLKGAEGTGETVVMSSSKAIDTYRKQQPSGAGGLPTISTQSTGGN